MKAFTNIEHKAINADDVIEWLERNVSMFWDSPCNLSRIVELFKKILAYDTRRLLLI